jgi:hypothetical protein
MRHDEFKIGLEFWCAGKRWRCTDKGSRVVVAVCLEPREGVLADDPSWSDGPPGVEHLFHEYDLPACSLRDDGASRMAE